MSKAEAFDDFIQELRKTGGDPKALAEEIAPEYDIQPSMLLRMFETRYPEGLPHVDLARATELAEAAKRKEIETALAESAAISDFYKMCPSSLPTTNKAAMQIIAENEMNVQLRAGVTNALEAWAGARYEDRGKNLFVAGRLADVKQQMREHGWKNVSRLDEDDMERLGFEIIEAQYVGGAKPTGKYVNVVVLRKIEE